MKNFLKIITCLCIGVAIANAEDIVFDSEHTDQGVIQFETETPASNPNAIKITKVRINESVLKPGEERDITLIIPGITNNKRTIIGKEAFRLLRSDQVRLKIGFEPVYKSFSITKKSRIYKDGKKDRWVKRKACVRLPEDCSLLFANSDSITAIDLSGVDRKATVRNTEFMFYECINLQSLNLSRFNTSNVTNMMAMFQGCGNLRNLDVSHLNTTSVTDMQWMFGRCYKLESLDLSKFNTRNVTTMAGMFANCEGLQNLNLRSFNTSNVIGMSFMFSGCSSLIDTQFISNFDMKNVRNISYMFAGCTNLAEVNYRVYQKMRNVPGKDDVFYGCPNLLINPFD